MTYGHSIRAFIEDGPVEQVAKIDAVRTTARAWRALDEVTPSPIDRAGTLRSKRRDASRSRSEPAKRRKGWSP